MLLVEEVAAMLRVSEDHVCDLIRSGALAAHNIGRRCYRVPKEDLDDFLARTRTPNATTPAGATNTAGV